jgi:septin 7
MKEQLERQRLELEEKKSRIESGRPLEKEPKRKGFSLR